MEAVAEGRTEHEVSAEIHNTMIRAGGEYMGLPVFIGSGPRTSLTHSTPTERRLEKGDVFTIELSGNVRRYSAALFRSIFIGNDPPKQVRDMMEACVAALNVVIDAIKPGVPLYEVERANRETMKKHGFEKKPSRTGYSIGINFPPDWGEGHALSLQEGEERLLEPGMVFHTPSSLRVYGQVGTATSETVLVTSTGCEVLTNCPPQGLIRKS